MINNLENFEKNLKNYIIFFNNEIEKINSNNNKKIIELMDVLIENKKHKIGKICNIEDNNNFLIITPLNENHIKFIEEKLKSIKSFSILIEKNCIKLKNNCFKNQEINKFKEIIKKKKEHCKTLLKNKRNLEMKEIKNDYKKKMEIQKIINKYNNIIEKIYENKVNNLIKTL